MFAKRLEIARRLIDGQTYEEIKDALKVTEKPITNMSNILANAGIGVRDAHNKLLIMEKKLGRKRPTLPRYKASPRLSELLTVSKRVVRSAYKKSSAQIN